MAGIFGGGGGTTPTPKYTGINLQTSTQGVAIPIVYGQNRIGTNIIWYNGFEARTTKVAGKGGLLGGGGKEYYYSADVILALCEGPITNVLNVWAGTTITNLENLGFSLFNGSKTQTPWSYIESKYPGQALSYAQTAYVAAAKYQLGTSPDLPSHNFEIAGFFWGSVSGLVDANFADIIKDYLTNPQYSIGMNVDSLDPVGLANYKTYTAAQGIFGSPAQVNQEQVSQTLQRWAQLTNSLIFWSGNQLKFVPLGDGTLTANGVTYEPQLTPVYNLTYDDFVVSSPGDAPVQIDFVDPADGFDRVQINILDRLNYYNNTPILWEDQTTVDELGQLQANIISATEICLQSIGQICAALIGQRAVYVNRTYTFKLSRRFIFIEPGDIYTITDPNIGLNNFRVRITGVKSGTDRILTVTAENMPQGVGTVATYAQQAANAVPAYDGGVQPGNVNPPAIFEPNAALTDGQAQVWIGASGGPYWGGAQIYLSFNDTDYSQIGTVNAGLLQGTLISSLVSHADPDTSGTLYVDLSESDGIMPSTATQADADALRTLILVDSEVMSYGTVTPGTLNAYSSDLTYLRRGQYGTTIASHAAGAEFTRIDESVIFTYGLPEEYVGGELYLKFVSYNIFGTQLQDISEVATYTYTPLGTAFTLAAPGIPTLAVSSTTQADGTTILTLTGSWSASAGPLLGSYETQFSINGGTTWTNDARVGASALTAALSPALASTNYLMRVRAVSQNGAATSAWSVSASFNTGSLVTSVPSAPTGIEASAVAGGALVTWTESASASTKGYQLSYGTTNVFGSATLYGATTSGSGLLVTGLTPGTLYYFWVQAFNAAGASAPDGPASATPTSVGGGAVFQQGSIEATGTATIGAGLTMTGTSNPTIALAAEAFLGTETLGVFSAFDFGAGFNAAISENTLSVAATGITFWNGESSVSSGLNFFSGTNNSFVAGEAGVTINSSGSGGGTGTLGVYFDDAIFSTLAEGSNITLTPGTGSSASVLTISAPPSGTGGSFVIANNGTSIGNAATLNFQSGLYATISGDEAFIFVGSPPSSPYQYWRFYCTRSNIAPGGNIALSEIQFDPGNGTFSPPSGGTPSASSDYSSSVALAFDGNESTFWASSGANVNDWIQYEFPSPQGFSRVQFAPRNDGYTNQGPIEIIVQVSDDGSSFTNLATLSPATWSAGAFQEFYV